MRVFLLYLTKMNELAESARVSLLRNDAAINFCHIKISIWSSYEGAMGDSLKLSSEGRNL